jgi:hypothetical protein
VSKLRHQVLEDGRVHVTLGPGRFGVVDPAEAARFARAILADVGTSPSSRAPPRQGLARRLILAVAAEPGVTLSAVLPKDGRNSVSKVVSRLTTAGLLTPWAQQGVARPLFLTRAGRLEAERLGAFLGAFLGASLGASLGDAGGRP